MVLFPLLQKCAQELSAGFELIRPDRREQLVQIAVSIVQRRLPLNFIFICTHNSRRSHMGQLWAQAAAFYYHIPQATTFSGGTEVTTLNPCARESLQQQGFRFRLSTPGPNPHYKVGFGEQLPTSSVYSKLYDNTDNPPKDFIAVLTCNSADEACPQVAGAVLRVALPYPDPKLADGSPQQTETYRERAREIGREMLYLFSKIKQLQHDC